MIDVEKLQARLKSKMADAKRKKNCIDYMKLHPETKSIVSYSEEKGHFDAVSSRMP